MTPAERMMAERNRIEASGAFYVTPYRMAKLMDAAGKIMNIMVKADTNICYEECGILLALVAAGISCVTEKEEDHGYDAEG